MADVELPVEPPYLLLFAGSSKAPDYETQHQILEANAERVPVVVEVMVDEESRAGREVLSNQVAAKLRDAHGVSEDGFRLVLIGARGQVIKQFAAPAKVEAILHHLSADS